MESSDVIKQPLITEKATWGSSELNHYAFHVDRRATKTQIKSAVEDLYKVRVVRVNTQNRKGRMRMYKYGRTQLPDVKRAIVRIHPEDKIELF
jgi:large subunit ribosomal protein L23